MSEAPERGLHLNRRRGMLGGVCAGLSDYLGVEVLFIRLAFVVATLFWPITLLVYGVLYLCLNDRPASEVARGLADNRLCRHLKQVDYGKRLYRSRYNRKLAGVCGGLADYLEISAFWIRVAFVISLFVWPMVVIVYLLAALLMDKEAPLYRQAPHSDAGETEPVARRPFTTRDVRDCRARFTELEGKLRRLEATITSRKFSLHREFRQM